MNETMTEADERLQRLYRNNYSLLTYLNEMRMPIPKVFNDIAEFIQNRGLQNALSGSTPVRTSAIRSHLTEAAKWKVPLDGVGIAHELEEVLERRLREFEADDANFSKLLEILHLVRLAEELPAEVNLGFVQNWFWRWYTHHKAPANPTTTESELENLASQLAERLKIRLPEKQTGKLTEGTSKDEHGSAAVSSHISTATEKNISV